MSGRISLILVLCGAVPVWSQVAPSVTGHGGNVANEVLMQTPPPVSGVAYPTAVGTASPSNYLRGSLVVNAAYNDNLFVSAGSAPITDMSYSVWPTVVIDKTTSRSHLMLTYSPGVTIYQHTSEENQQSQNLSFDSQYQLTPHMTVSVQDEFRKSSNILNQSNPLSGVEVSGSAQSPIVPVITPFANQTSNIVSAELTYQFWRNDMIGGSGTFAFLDYPEPDQAQGFYNSSSRGGTAFYSHRLSVDEYFGGIYQYFENLDTPVVATNPTQGETQVNSALFFYTRYLNSTLSFSVLAGFQHYDVSALPSPPAAGWTPAVIASVGWQGPRKSLAAAYSRQITAGGGLLGAFYGNSATISGQWQMARTWGAGLAANYTHSTNVSTSVSDLYPGGTFASGTVAVHHELSENLKVEIGYTRLHQDYSGNVTVISNSPDTNREYIQVSYQFLRPLGR